MKTIFTPEATAEFNQRLNNLTHSTQPLWGKMDVGQMLAHLNVSYDTTYSAQPKKYSFLAKMLMKLVVKNVVVSAKPYAKNGRTAPNFLITEPRDFELEKTKLIANIQKTEGLGIAHFEGLENQAFGKLTSTEWSNLFGKHLDHHLKQFGV